MKQITVAEFLAKIEEIYKENPQYERGHDGSDGMCDCIGLLKGALRRNGVTPVGMKGCNYAARFTLTGMRAIRSEADLRLGDAVLKAIEPGGSGYDLPDEYKAGGASYNGDLKDYSHIGVVTHLNPLEITHMTSPCAKKDPKIGRWAYAGELPAVDYSAAPSPGPDPEPALEPVVLYAKVLAESGTTVNMRKGPSTSKALVERIPIGDEVVILDAEADWCQCAWVNKWGKTLNGWIMRQFLVFDEGTDPAEDAGIYPDPDAEGEPAEGGGVTLWLRSEDAELIGELLDMAYGRASGAMERLEDKIITLVGGVG